MKFPVTTVLSMVLSASWSARAFSRAAIFASKQSQQRRSCPSSATQSLKRTMTASSTTAASTSVNPLLQQEDLPKFASIQPKDLSPAVEELLNKMQADFTSLENTLETKASQKEVDYQQVLPELERLQHPLGFAWGIAGHLNGVANGEELRKAYEENQPKIVQAMSQFAQSKPLYDALEIVEQQLAAEEQKTEDAAKIQQKKRAVDISLRDMKLGGVGLEGADKEKFNEMKMRLAQLSTTFSNNVLDETKAFSLTVDDAAKLKDVPESARAMWANAHVTAVKEQDPDSKLEMDPENGPWRITLDIPSYIAVLSHVRDRGIREQVYKASITRASEKNPDKNNVPLIYEILKLKNEMAQMLGFKNYAEQSLSRKMAPNVQSVNELSDLILEKALPAAEKELAEITALAREQGGDEYSEENLEKLMPWDTTFWSERLKESKFELTEEETRPYFALPAVLDGMFSLVSRIFNIEVKEGEAEVWNEDVKFFNVYDKDSGKHIASFYLDPYSRPANKRGGVSSEWAE